VLESDARRPATQPTDDEGPLVVQMALVVDAKGKPLSAKGEGACCIVDGKVFGMTELPKVTAVLAAYEKGARIELRANGKLPYADVERVLLAFSGTEPVLESPLEFKLQDLVLTKAQAAADTYRPPGKAPAIQARSVALWTPTEDDASVSGRQIALQRPVIIYIRRESEESVRYEISDHPKAIRPPEALTEKLKQRHKRVGSPPTIVKPKADVPWEVVFGALYCARQAGFHHLGLAPTK